MGIDSLMKPHVPFTQFAIREELEELLDARAVLSPTELRNIAEIYPSKRPFWIAGRYCAKRAIFQAHQLAWSDEKGQAISIINDERGVPSAIVHDTHIHFERTRMSITHTKGYVCAVVVLEKDATGIGVDVERIRTFSPEFLKAFLTDREYRWCSESHNEAKIATTLWCIKEAYLKAIGTGLRIHPRRIEVVGGGDAFAEYPLLQDGIQQRVCIDWTMIDDLYILVTIILP